MGYKLYDLTDLTGQRAGEKREVTIATIDMRPKVMIVVALSSLPGLMVAAALWPLLDVYAILVPFIISSACVWLFTAKTRDARQMPQYRALLDARLAKRRINKFYIGSKEFDPTMSDLEVLYQSAEPPDEQWRAPITESQRNDNIERLLVA